MRKWNSIQKRMVRNLINPKQEVKRIYKENGGEWTVLNEEQKIKKGYIQVDYYMAYDLSFSEEYKKTRNNNSYVIDTDNLNNITKIYENQKDYSKFKNSFSSYSESLIEKLEIDNIYTIIHSNFNSIFDLDENTSISTENLLSKISNNKKEISKLETNIASENDKLENAEGMIRSAIHQRNKYTETIGIETIEKVREKAQRKKKKEKH